MASSHEPSSLLNSTVKELADYSIHGTISLPSIFISRNPVVEEAETVVKEEIPTIDLFLLRNGSVDERSRIIGDIGRACKEWGCFTVVNHGIPESLQRAMMEEFTGFFNLPEKEKEVYKTNNGFESICHGTSTTIMGHDVRFWRDFLRIVVHPLFHSPTKPMDFRKISEEYAQQTREICNEIMRAISESLELEENFVDEFLHLASCRQVITGNIYPSCTQAELVMGLPPHSDPTFLTLLMQNDDAFNGLQVLHNEKWVVIDLIPQSFILLSGDFVEIVSNGRYRGVVHRAMVSNKSTRISVGASIMPSLEDVLFPASKLLEGADNTTKFRGLTFKDFVLLKLQNKAKNSAMELITL